eukprot:3045764-Prymnesium_polylepis.4
MIVDSSCGQIRPALKIPSGVAPRHAGSRYGGVLRSRRVWAALPEEVAGKEKAAATRAAMATVEAERATAAPWQKRWQQGQAAPA